MGRIVCFTDASLRLSLAIIFIWFGALKLVDLCPLASFISRSLPFLCSYGFLTVLGCWEVAIGICLLVPSLVRPGLWLLLFHLPGTALPFLVIPNECFTHFPFGLTLEGQYIVKNLALASAALVIATQHGRQAHEASADSMPIPEAYRGQASAH
jgi:uncharacterized membrane protein YkgB